MNSEWKNMGKVNSSQEAISWTKEYPLYRYWAKRTDGFYIFEYQVVTT